GRVRGDHLDLHALTGIRKATAEVTSGLDDGRQRFAVPGVGEPEIHKPRSGDLCPLDGGEVGCLARDLLGKLARRSSALGREPQRGVRRVVAVLRVARPLELDGRTYGLAQL